MMLQDLKDAIAAAEKQGYDPRFIPVNVQDDHGRHAQSADASAWSSSTAKKADRAEMVSRTGLAFTIVT